MSSSHSSGSLVLFDQLDILFLDFRKHALRKIIRIYCSVNQDFDSK